MSIQKIGQFLHRLVVYSISFLVFIVAIQNMEVTSIQFLHYTFSSAKVILIPLIFCLGIIVGWVMAWKKHKFGQADSSENSRQDNFNDAE